MRWRARCRRRDQQVVGRPSASATSATRPASRADTAPIAPASLGIGAPASAARPASTGRTVSQASTPTSVAFSSPLPTWSAAWPPNARLSPAAGDSRARSGRKAPRASRPRVCSSPTPSATSAAAASGTASTRAITPRPVTSAAAALPSGALAAANAPFQYASRRAVAVGPCTTSTTIAAVIAAADVASRLNATSPRRRASSRRFGVGSSVRSEAMGWRPLSRRYFFGAGAAPGGGAGGAAGFAPGPPPAAAPDAPIICCINAA